jgi:geranylgeranyl diphosphate synthase type I
MVGNKTGALLSCAAAIGAELGGAPDPVADALAAYGQHLGLAFQAVDDLLGIWGDPRSTGKRTWSDLRQRKKSLPVTAALSARGPAAERLTALLTADAKKSPEEFRDFDEAEFAARAALIEEAGGRRWTAEEAARQHGAALAALRGVPLPAAVRDQLVALADFVVARQG